MKGRTAEGSLAVTSGVARVRFARWIRVFAIASVTALVAVVAAPMVVHEWRLYGARRTFAMSLHPQGTERISLRAEVGLLSGDGNHCDFIVMETRRATVTRESIDAWYQAHPEALRAQNVGWETFVVTVDCASVAQPVLSLNGQRGDGFSTVEHRILQSTARALWCVERRRLYWVGVTSYGQEPEGDWRCH